MPILETNRLILRDLRRNDLDDVYGQVYADPDVKNPWSGAQGTPEELKERFARKYIDPGTLFGLKGVALKKTGELMGVMGYQAHDPGEGEAIYYLLSVEEPYRRVGFDPNYIEAELTYAFGKAYWKQGFATEMGRAIVPWGFETVGLGRIIQGVPYKNATSIALMQRLGFRLERRGDGNGVVGILADYEGWKSQLG